MSFWKGAFVPLTKHLKSIRVIPLAHMTKEDWDILDYENLRPSARYNLDKRIIAGDLYGFYRVSIDQHLGKAHSPHGGKEHYYLPIREIESTAGDPSQTEFPEDFDFDATIKQDEVPKPPPGYLALWAILLAKTIEQQYDVLVEIENESPDLEDELLDEAWLLWAEVARVLTLMARAYRLFKLQTPEESKEFLLWLGLRDEEIRNLLDEIEATYNEME